MLRITTTSSSSSVRCVKLEGKLLQLWVDEVRSLFEAPSDAPLPRLDLSEITFVDDAGIALLLQLLERGVQVTSCAPYVAELLRRERNQTR